MGTIIAIIIGLLVFGLVIWYWKQILSIAFIGGVSFYAYKSFGLYGLGVSIGVVLLCTIFTMIGWLNVLIFACLSGLLGALFVFAGLIAFCIGVAVILILYVIREIVSNNNEKEARYAIAESFRKMGMADINQIAVSVKNYDKLIMKKSLYTLTFEVLNKLINEEKAEVIIMKNGDKVYKIKDITQGMNFVRREIPLD